MAVFISRFLCRAWLSRGSRRCRSRGSDLLLLIALLGGGFLPLEDVADFHPEHLGDAEGRFEGRRVLVLLDGRDSLAGHADPVGQLLLRHLIVVETQPADGVADWGRGHQAVIRNMMILPPSRTSSTTTMVIRKPLTKMIAVLPAGSSGKALRIASTLSSPPISTTGTSSSSTLKPILSARASICRSSSSGGASMDCRAAMDRAILRPIMMMTEMTMQITKRLRMPSPSMRPASASLQKALK